VKMGDETGIVGIPTANPRPRRLSSLILSRWADEDSRVPNGARRKLRQGIDKLSIDD
jgi:hypothetical protein